MCGPDHLVSGDGAALDEEETMGRSLVSGVVGLVLLVGCGRGGAGAGATGAPGPGAPATTATSGAAPPQGSAATVPTNRPAPATTVVGVDLEPVEALLVEVDQALREAEPGDEADPAR